MYCTTYIYIYASVYVVVYTKIYKRQTTTTPTMHVYVYSCVPFSNIIYFSAYYCNVPAPETINNETGIKQNQIKRMKYKTYLRNKSPSAFRIVNLAFLLSNRTVNAYDNTIITIGMQNATNDPNTQKYELFIIQLYGSGMIFLQS